MLLRIARLTAVFLVCVPLIATTVDRGELLRIVEGRALQRSQAGDPADPPPTLLILYGDDARAAGLTMRELTDAYDRAYQRGLEKRPLFKKLTPSTGWLVALLLLVGLVVRDILKNGLKKLMVAAGELLYQRLAGIGFLRGLALRRYRAALRGAYSTFPVPFKSDLKLPMSGSYVPLRVRGDSSGDVDAYILVRQSHRVLVVGAPGSGKSLLLRNIALAYGENRHDWLGGIVPVLLELNRLNDTDIDFVGQLVDVFERRDFPRAASFVDAGLRDGYLLLLLDGFDEVTSARREEVTRQINDLMDRHPQCRFIITCRGPVYHGEFDANLDDHLEVVDFTDQQIMTFLRPWQPNFPEGKTVEQLLQTLRDRPAIMLLARNPLLLTIVAFLYTDVEFILPHSRAEFYDQTADVLLRQLKKTRNVYKAPQKRLVLQHLALYNQFATGETQDRRSIGINDLLREFRHVLPDLTLSPSDAQPLLDEIVERSGLLLYIDGNTRCQFAHLTLQEYFAAAALASDGDRLIQAYRSDPDTWREVVKLWCGLEHDSTAFIQTLHAFDPSTAFECLADAQKIDPAAADKLIDEFWMKFEAGTDISERIQRAFAAVASDRRSRGTAIFTDLCDAVVRPGKPDVAEAAAYALSLTNLSRAAEFLATACAHGVHVESALVRMGDIAVGPVAFELVRKGRVSSAIAILSRIGTPAAVRCLLDMLLRPETPPAAAIAIARIFGGSAAKEAIGELKITDEQLKLVEWAPWAWAPFDEGKGEQFRFVAGRLVTVLSRHLLQAPEVIEGVDPRLLRALIFALRTDLGPAGAWISGGVDLPLDRKNATMRVVNDEKVPLRVRALCAALLSLPFEDRKHVWYVIGNATDSTVADWENLRRKITYDLATGLHMKLIVVLQFVCSVVAASAAAYLVATASSAITLAFPGAVLISIIIAWYWRWTGIPAHDEDGPNLEDWILISTAYFTLPAMLVARRVFHPGRRRPATENLWHEVWVRVPVCLFMPGVAIYSFLGVEYVFGTAVASSVLLSVVALAVALLIAGVKKERIARNPLAGILETAVPSAGTREHVLTYESVSRVFGWEGPHY